MYRFEVSVSIILFVFLVVLINYNIVSCFLCRFPLDVTPILVCSQINFGEEVIIATYILCKT